MHPGSLREFSALFLIIVMNSSIRSGLISASTIIEKGLDMSLVLLVKVLLLARKFGWLALLNAEEERRSKKQALERYFILPENIFLWEDFASRPAEEYLIIMLNNWNRIRSISTYFTELSRERAL